MEKKRKKKREKKGKKKTKKKNISIGKSAMPVGCGYKD